MEKEEQRETIPSMQQPGLATTQMTPRAPVPIATEQKPDAAGSGIFISTTRTPESHLPVSSNAGCCSNRNRSLKLFLCNGGNTSNPGVFKTPSRNTPGVFQHISPSSLPFSFFLFSSLLFSLLFSSLLFSSLLLSSPLFSSLLLSSPLLSSRLFSSHLFSSLLISSHLFSSFLISSSLLCSSFLFFSQGAAAAAAAWWWWWWFKRAGVLLVVNCFASLLF